MKGTNTLLFGDTGSGKTYSIRTFIDQGITPFVITTEPGIESTLGDIPDEKLHWKYIPHADVTWDDMLAGAKKINMLTYDALAKSAPVDKQKYGQFLEVVTSCKNFVCDRCGESFGDVGTWGTDRALIIDSLSGLNIMAMDLVVGSKPTKGMQDWMVAMDNLERFINLAVAQTKCWFVLTAHPEREKDEVTGAVQIMVSTLGRKVAPRLPRFFDDTIYARRDGNEFHWSTAATNTNLKARNLPISDKLVPDFGQIVKVWKEKGGVVGEPIEPKKEAV